MRKKCQMEEVHTSKRTACSDISKRLLKNIESHPRQLDFYKGKVTPHGLVFGIFFSLIHGVVINKIFPTFTVSLFMNLLTQAGQIFEEDNSSHPVPGQCFLSLLFAMQQLKVLAYYQRSHSWTRSILLLPNMRLNV